MDENGDNQISKEEFLTALLQAGGTTPSSLKGSGGASPSRLNRGDDEERRVD